MPIGSARAGLTGRPAWPFDPNAKGAAVVLSQNFQRLTSHPSVGGYGLARSRRGHLAGSNQRRYFEVYQENFSPMLDSIVIGPAGLNLNADPTTQIGGHVTSMAPSGSAADDIYLGNVLQRTGLARGGAQTVSVLVVFYGNRTELFMRNLTMNSAWFPNDPASTGQDVQVAIGSPVYFYLGWNGGVLNGTVGWVVNVGQRPFTGALPSGAVAWR